MGRSGGERAKCDFQKFQKKISSVPKTPKSDPILTKLMFRILPMGTIQNTSLVKFGPFFGDLGADEFFF